MSQELEERLADYFDEPLKEGEVRKILYLYDLENTYFDQIKEWIEDSNQVILLRINKHNYFKTQVKIERDYKQKHLFLYFEMDKPQPRENPLLDVLFYSEELKVDQESQLFLSIGIDPHREDLAAIVKLYPVFFKNKSRINRMKKLWEKVPFNTVEYFEYSILASLVKAESADWMNIWIVLFEEEALGVHEKWDQLLKFGNIERFWTIVDQLVGYTEYTSAVKQKSVNDLMHHVFITHLNAELEGQLPKKLKPYVLAQANPIIVFINQWMNTKTQDQSYQLVANMVQDDFDFSNLFEELPSKLLSQLETFQWFDHELINRLTDSIESIETDELQNWITQRRNTFWYSKFKLVYQFFKQAIYLVKYAQQTESVMLGISTKEAFLELYTSKLYKLDQAYRKMNRIYEMLDSECKDKLSDQLNAWNRLADKRYLELFADKWDRLVETDSSQITDKLQKEFYQKEVFPFVESNRRIIVIISDGLRYEVGEELYSKLISEKRFNGVLEWMQSNIPSITSLGMASLLPHEHIEMNDSGDILIDGKKHTSIQQRQQLIEEQTQELSLAITADELLNSNQAKLRKILNGKKVIYIYHNYIDAIGDNQKTEHDVLRATEASIDQLWRLMNRLTVEVSVNQFLLTADHGFLYNRNSIKTSDKALIDMGEGAILKNKRFLVTRSPLSKDQGISISLENDLNLNAFVTVPRGINRFALRGGGNQYVHGGHLPQETVVPLLKIKTDRSRNELDKVAVSLITQTRRITNTVLWLSLLQVEPVTNDKHKRYLKMYFESVSEMPISNKVTIIADKEATSSDQRVFTEKFIFFENTSGKNDNCYLIIKDESSEEILTREIFELDLI